jgi:hypothetical protein
MSPAATYRLVCASILVMGTFSPNRTLAQQGLSNLWTGGYTVMGIDTSLGGLNLDYFLGGPVITTEARWMDYGRTVANMADEGGQLRFSTNGVYVANAAGNLMVNGDSLNPSWYASLWTAHPSGMHIAQGSLILPYPDSSEKYFIIHSTIDDPGTSSSYHIYLTTVDMALNEGAGGVVEKNQVLVADTLVPGHITAVRHANGRDWWVICHKAFSNVFYRLLATPQGVLVAGTQAIGMVHECRNGQACFSPDGSRYAYYNGPEGLEVYDFDRCTGLLSAPRYAAMPEYNNIGLGVAWAPGGQYLYTTTALDVYQLDDEAPDLEASRIHLAHWDSTYSPSPPFATMFDIAQLAPDGKIYISTGNGTLRLHVINNPDEPGLACNLVQHGVILPRVNANSLPNHPNYFLGPVEGSVCDSLGITTLAPSFSPGERGVRVQPNPSMGAFRLHYPAHPAAGRLEVRDMQGRLVLRDYIAPWSTVHAVELAGQAAGLYNCSLRWGMESLNARVIIATP